jgi:hypothetical protein
VVRAGKQGDWVSLALAKASLILPALQRKREATMEAQAGRVVPYAFPDSAGAAAGAVLPVIQPHKLRSRRVIEDQPS